MADSQGSRGDTLANNSFKARTVRGIESDYANGCANAMNPWEVTAFWGESRRWESSPKKKRSEAESLSVTRRINICKMCLIIVASAARKCEMEPEVWPEWLSICVFNLSNRIYLTPMAATDPLLPTPTRIIYEYATETKKGSKET